MHKTKKQGELFKNNKLEYIVNKEESLLLNRTCIEDWQKRICSYQHHFFKGSEIIASQGCFFENSEEVEAENINPLDLAPLPLSFWRWPTCPHKGPAIYWVLDHQDYLDNHLLLYIGETIAADRRWKGEHDCKGYLAAYCESISNAGFTTNLSIRFWTDVPKKTRERRNLEQSLIRKWLPPFNKETRSRWKTPFI